MANCCQKVRGNKTKPKTKQQQNKNQKQNETNKQPNKKANKNKKTKEQQEQNRTMGAEAYKANNYSNVIINIDLRERHTEGEG